MSHHTGSNFQTDKLESIIIRFAKQELSNVTNGAAEEDEDYFTADKRDDEARDVTLQKLFDMAISQLVDYSSIAIPQSTTTAVFPLRQRRIIVRERRIFRRTARPVTEQEQDV